MTPPEPRSRRVQLAGIGAGILPSIALYQGLAGGSLLSTILLYDVLFGRPPTDPTRTTTVASVVVGIGWLCTVVMAL